MVNYDFRMLITSMERVEASAEDDGREDMQVQAQGHQRSEAQQRRAVTSSAKLGAHEVDRGRALADAWAKGFVAGSS